MMRIRHHRLVKLLVGIIAAAAATHAGAQTPNEVLGGARTIVTADGISEQGLVPIGGIPQWISVRGRHKSNPLLLFLHGGPAFTVVQWDQRGAGKTYAASDPEKIKDTMTVDRIVADAEELIGYLRQKYGKDRIVLMAHSFGTLLGVKLAQRHPDWFFAYVGMGQFTDALQSEAEGYAATLAAAKADKNDKAVSALSAIAPFPDREHPQRNLENLGTERFWLATYGGYYWPSGFGHNGEIAKLSPDYSPAKRLVWFEDSAHMVYEEEPGKTLESLVRHVLPLTPQRLLTR